MKPFGALLLAVLVLLGITLLPTEPVTHADSGREDTDATLLARIERLEAMIEGGRENRELAQLNLRIAELEKAVERELEVRHEHASKSQPVDDSRWSREIGDLRQTVTSFGSKLNSLERSVSPLQRDISSLRLSVSRVESSVNRLSYRH